MWQSSPLVQQKRALVLLQSQLSGKSARCTCSEARSSCGDVDSSGERARSSGESARSCADRTDSTGRRGDSSVRKTRLPCESAGSPHGKGNSSETGGRCAHRGAQGFVQVPAGFYRLPVWCLPGHYRESIPCDSGPSIIRSPGNSMYECTVFALRWLKVGLVQTPRKPLQTVHQPRAIHQKQPNSGLSHLRSEPPQADQLPKSSGPRHGHRQNVAFAHIGQCDQPAECRSQEGMLR